MRKEGAKRYKTVNERGWGGMMAGKEKAKSAPIRLWLYITVTGEPSGSCVCVCIGGLFMCVCVCVCLGMLCWPLITPQQNCHSHAFTHSRRSVGTVCVCLHVCEYLSVFVCVSICLSLSLSLSACLSVSLLLYSLIPLQYQRPWFKTAGWLHGEPTDREETRSILRS